MQNGRTLRSFLLSDILPPSIRSFASDSVRPYPADRPSEFAGAACSLEKGGIIRKTNGFYQDKTKGFVFPNLKVYGHTITRIYRGADSMRR